MSFCQRCEREHQDREFPVRCLGCRQVPVWNAHGLCAVCLVDEWQQRQDEVGDAIFLRMMEERGL